MDEGHTARSWAQGRVVKNRVLILGWPGGQTPPLRRLPRGPGGDSELPIFVQQGEDPPPALGWERWMGQPDSSSVKPPINGLSSRQGSKEEAPSPGSRVAVNGGSEAKTTQ